MKRYNMVFAVVLSMVSITSGFAQTIKSPTIEVTGSATINIVPDRITIEVGMEEYYKVKVFGDSSIVRLSDIEKNVRTAFAMAGVPDNQIVVSDIGNYRNRDVSANFLMAKRLSATVTNFSQIENIYDRLDRRGITSFNITRIENSDMERYNREGLKAALDAARDKAEYIAENEGLTITMPYEIVENGPNYYESPSFSNVAFDSGSGMENLRRIVRRYSVKVSYMFSPE